MAGRFLYGDSEPFPGGFDVLSTLRTFVAASSRVLLIQHEADELERSLGARAQEHIQALEVITSFFEQVTNLVAERAVRSPLPQVIGPFAAQLLEQIELIEQQARADRGHELDGSSGDVAARVREKRNEVRKLVAEYLLGDPLPALSWALSLNLAGTAPNGQVVIEHPGDLTTSFMLEVARDPAWSRARRIGDISPGLTLQVGFKKSFLRSSLHPDLVVLDELVIASLELGPDSLELHLRRKLDAPRDAFVLTVDPEERGGFVSRITRFDERGVPTEPFTLTGEEARRGIELMTVLRGECSSLLSSKKRLLSAQLDGHDVFDRSLVVLLFQRISDRLAPSASEVGRHSPNPAELSLKLEKEGGRREELYLKKSDLVALVSPLPPELQALYSKLSFMSSSSASFPPPPFIRELEIVGDESVSSAETSATASQESNAAASMRPRPATAPPPPKRRW